MSNLMKASDLRMPSISGTVSVPLAELDQMRLEHANAVRVAKDLEEKQAMVRVIVEEQRRKENQWGNLVVDTVELNREYKGFDSFRAIIAEEERKKLQKEIEFAQQSSNEAWDNANREAKLRHDAERKTKSTQEDLKSIKNELAEANKIIELEKSNVSVIEQKLKTAEYAAENRLTVIEGLRKQLDETSKTVKALQQMKERVKWSVMLWVKIKKLFSKTNS